MKTSKFFIIAIIAILLVFTAITCTPAASPSPSPTPKPSPSPSPSPKPMPTEKVEWKFQAYAGNIDSERVQNMILTELVPGVAAKTNGNFTIQPFYYGELGLAWDQNPAAVGEGIVEMSHTYGGYHLGDLPIGGYSELPMLSLDGDIADFKGLHELFSPIMHDLYLEKYGAEIISSGIYTWSAPMMGKPFPDILDWGGLKVRTPGAGMAEYVEVMGGVNVYTAWAEMYQAMKLGTIDGVYTSIRATVTENLWELMSHLYDFRVLSGEHFTFVNPDALAALPPEYRDVLLEEMARVDDLLWSELLPTDKVANEVFDFCESKGIEVVRLSPDDAKKMQDKCIPLWEEWADENGAQGREMLDKMYDLFGIDQ